MIYSISKLFSIKSCLGSRSVCIAILGHLDRIAEPVGNLLNTDKSSRREQRRECRPHFPEWSATPFVSRDMVLEGSPHVIAIAVSPALNFLGTEKITRDGRERRKVAPKEFPGSSDIGTTRPFPFLIRK